MPQNRSQLAAIRVQMVRLETLLIERLDYMILETYIYCGT